MLAVTAVLLVIVAFGIEVCLDSLVLKPIIGVARPSGFTVGSEPFFMRLAHGIIGVHNDVPSGGTARQLLLACLLTLLIKRPNSLPSRPMRLAIIGLAWLAVPIVGALRLFVGAHSIEAVTAGVSSGIVEFGLVSKLVEIAWPSDRLLRVRPPPGP